MTTFRRGRLLRPRYSFLPQMENAIFLYINKTRARS